MPVCRNSSNLSAIAAKAFSPVLIVLRRKEFADCAEEEKKLLIVLIVLRRKEIADCADEKKI